MCVISCIRLLICASDRIRQKAFPVSSRILDFTHGKVWNNQLSTSHTLIQQEKALSIRDTSTTLIINCLSQ
jgi:hypothetical protein